MQLHPPPGRAESAESHGQEGVGSAACSGRDHSPQALPPAPLSTGDTAAQTAAGGQGPWKEAVQDIPGAVSGH